uniref:Uncharacterized protein n=1 Tax=Glossina palpalis gambiensis TaxID=67801 RepID=A0A1B0BMX0_9MUSC
MLIKYKNLTGRHSTTRVTRVRAGTTLRGVNANVAALAISVLSSSGKKHKLIELPITTAIAIAIATATTILVKIFQDTLQLLMHLTHWEIMRTE